MKEGWMKKGERWSMNDEGLWFKAVVRLNEQTDGWTKGH